MTDPAAVVEAPNTEGPTVDIEGKKPACNLLSDDKTDVASDFVVGCAVEPNKEGGLFDIGGKSEAFGFCLASADAVGAPNTDGNLVGIGGKVDDVDSFDAPQDFVAFPNTAGALVGIGGKNAAAFEATGGPSCDLPDAAVETGVIDVASGFVVGCAVEPNTEGGLFGIGGKSEAFGFCLASADSAGEPNTDGNLFGIGGKVDAVDSFDTPKDFVAFPNTEGALVGIGGKNAAAFEIAVGPSCDLPDAVETGVMTFATFESSPLAPSTTGPEKELNPLF